MSRVFNVHKTQHRLLSSSAPLAGSLPHTNQPTVQTRQVRYRKTFSSHAIQLLIQAFDIDTLCLIACSSGGFRSRKIRSVSSRSNLEDLCSTKSVNDIIKCTPFILRSARLTNLLHAKCGSTVLPALVRVASLSHVKSHIAAEKGQSCDTFMNVSTFQPELCAGAERREALGQ